MSYRGTVCAICSWGWDGVGMLRVASCYTENLLVFPVITGEGIKIGKIQSKQRETKQWVTEPFTTTPKYFRGICVLARTVSTQGSAPMCWSCWGFCLEQLVQVALCGWEEGCQCLFFFPALKTRGLDWLLHLLSLQGLLAAPTQPHISPRWLHPYSHSALHRLFC